LYHNFCLNRLVKFSFHIASMCSKSAWYNETSGQCQISSQLLSAWGVHRAPPTLAAKLCTRCVNVLDHSGTMIIFLEGTVNVNLQVLLHVDLNVRKYFRTLNFSFDRFIAGHAYLTKGFFAHISHEAAPELYTMP
jgi:hypothetical protein